MKFSIHENTAFDLRGLARDGFSDTIIALYNTNGKEDICHREISKFALTLDSGRVDEVLYDVFKRIEDNLRGDKKGAVIYDGTYFDGVRVLFKYYPQIASRAFPFAVGCSYDNCEFKINYNTIDSSDIVFITPVDVLHKRGLTATSARQKLPIQVWSDGYFYITDAIHALQNVLDGTAVVLTAMTNDNVFIERAYSLLQDGRFEWEKLKVFNTLTPEQQEEIETHLYKPLYGGASYVI